MTMPLSISVMPVLQSFHGAGYEAMIHVPEPNAGHLRDVVAEYAGRLGYSFLAPEIRDARLGAVQEGIFRRHMILADGHVRDSVYFSVVDGDWPAVKAALEKRLKY